MSSKPPAASQPTPAPDNHYRSKTIAAWLALFLGALGLHRMYLYGLGDRVAWLYPLPTALGLLGVQRMDSLGQDDRLSWVLIPILGLMISLAMFSAIHYALTPDEKWDQRHNPGRPGPGTGWGAVGAAVLGLFIGGGVLTGTIAFGGQKFFEWQIESERKTAAQAPDQGRTSIPAATGDRAGTFADAALCRRWGGVHPSPGDRRCNT